MIISPKILVALRKDRGWSQEKLAAISDVSERTIQRAEKDGSCSLDTKLALATAFDLSPAELSDVEETRSNNSKKEYLTDWSGAFGLFVLGLLAAAIVLLTGTNGQWEVASLVVVWGLTIILSVMTFGARGAYRLFDNTSWIVKYPTFVRGLSTYIVQAQSVIQYSYIIGVVASLVTGLSIAVHASTMLNDPTEFITIIIRPLIYSIIFVELWFRPYKKKMEKMLSIQVAATENSD